MNPAEHPTSRIARHIGLPARWTISLLGMAFLLISLAAAARAASNGPVPPARDCHATLSWVRDRPIVDDNQYTVTFYVSPAGADTNPGTKDAPFATIQHAVDLAEPGAKILVMPGIYNEAVRMTHSGAPGKPITLEGVISPEGEWQTVIYPATLLKDWQPAPEIGKGVYKCAVGKLNPMEMESRYCKIARVYDPYMTKINKYKLSGPVAMNIPPDGEMPNEPGKFWDAAGAIFGVLNGTAYIRFRNYDDPNTLGVHASPRGSAGVTIRDQNYVIVRGFLISGAEKGVAIIGAASNNIIEKNLILNGRIRVSISGGASRNHVRYNELKANFLTACHPGAWEEQFRQGGPSDVSLTRRRMYEMYKFLFESSSSDDYACCLYGCFGDDNEIYGNHLHDGLVGVTGGGSAEKPLTNFKVYNNIFHNFSSLGISVYVYQLNSEYFDNLFYDNNINVRLHRISQEGDQIRNHKIYDNFFFNPPGMGTHHHFYFERWNVDMPMTMWFYHNSYAGGEKLFTGISIKPENAGKVPGVFFINNICSANILLYTNQDTVTNKGAMGPFDYNWVGGIQWHNLPPWFDKHNIFAERKKLWDDAWIPDFLLAKDSPCRNAGLDLSKPFVLEGKTYDPLPGMTPGYFTGPAPDLGAVQYGKKPFFLDFIKELPRDPKLLEDKKPWGVGL